MKKALKFLLWLIGIAVLLIIAAVIVIPMVVDPNDYKGLIINKVKEQTGRDLEITEPIELSVFPWVGVETGGVTLDNAPGFDARPFAQVEHAAVRVKLLPLLSRELQVGKLELSGLELYLARNEAGVGNWEDLAGNTSDKPAPSSEDTSGPGLANFSIGGLEITRASLEWDDRAAKQNLRIEELRIVTGKISPDDAIDFELGFALSNKQPQATANLDLSGIATVNLQQQQFAIDQFNFALDAEGEALLDGKLHSELTAKLRIDGAQQQIHAEQVRLTADLDSPQLKLTSRLDTELAADGAADQVRIEPVRLHAEISGANIATPIQAEFTTRLELKPQAGLLSIPELDLTADGIHLSGELEASELNQQPTFSGKLDLAEFNARQWLAEHGIELPPMSAEDALTRIAAKLSLKGSAGDTLKLQVEPINLQFDQSSINGLARIEGEHKGFELHIDQIDADRYLPPATDDAPTAQPGNGEGTDENAELIPVDTLRPLAVDGLIEVEQLKIKGLNLQKARIKLDAGDARIDVKPSIGALYQGNYQGQVTLDLSDAATPKMHLTQKLQDVQIGPLLRDLTASEERLMGRGGFSSNLRTSGNSLAAIKQKLNGELDFMFLDGAVKGFNLAQIIRSTRARFGGESAPETDTPMQTDFSELGGSAEIKDGVLHNQDLLAKSPLLRVNGAGTADLVNENLNYTVTTTIVETLKGQGGEGLKELKGVPIPIHLSGPFNAPDYKIEWAKILAESQKQRIKDKVEKKIEEKLNIQGAGKLLEGLF